ncbi:uncharacterized protein BDV14DRAFT_173004 [Aspergillus stella-maris]|uniref:uncharacterized protein n=1 Tax=Aspergillus stella-maris TaxID=1810926 RepID=UPI003CCD6AFD
MAHITTLSTRSIRRLPKPYNRHQCPTPSQTRSLWSCSNQRHYNPHNLHKHHIRLILNNHQRNQKSYKPYREDRDRDSRTIYPDYHFHTWRSPSWHWSGHKYSYNPNDGYARSQRYARHRRRDDDGVFFHDRARQHIDWIKKKVERDPYEAVFGKRSNLAPFGLGSGFNLENGFTALCRSFFGLDNEDAKPAKESKESKNPKDSKHVDTTDTVDTNTVKATDEVKDTIGDKKQKAEDEYAPQTQPWPSSTRDGIEFDPISGRMVPRPSGFAKLSEEDYKHLSATGPKIQGLDPWPYVDFPSIERLEKQKLERQKLEKQAQAGLRVPPTHDIVDSTYQEAPNGESQKQRKDVFKSPFTLQDTTFTTPSNRKVSDSIPEPLDEGWSQEAIEALSDTVATTHSEKEYRSLADKASFNVMSHDAEQPSQSRQSDIKADPETSVGEHREMNDKNEPAGYLSKRIGDAVAPSYRDRIRAQEVTNHEYEDLEALRASDIRAAYETRKQSILSETKAEANKEPIESVFRQGGKIVNVEGYFEEQEKLHSSTPSNKWISAAYRATRQNVPSETKAKVNKIPIEPFLSSYGRCMEVNAYLAAQEALDSARRPNKLPETPTEEPLPESALTETATESQATSATNEPLISEKYRIFAYDRTTSLVTEGETISSLPASSEHVHPTDILARLKYPAKFLPCLNQMHAEGYEIVSGGKDILVFRKVPESENFVDDISKSAAVSPSSQDDLYTGNSSGQSSSDQSQQNAPKGRVRNALRRMAITGVATAGTCYAIGVVSEYFRTGGEDGWGVDAFTVFESERRHRER